jgi:hypothetical protein
MKTYIQVIDKKGKVTFLFHDDNKDSDSGSYLIYGRSIYNFEVLIVDKKGKNKYFTFDSDSIGNILSSCISPNTEGLVKKICIFKSKDLDGIKSVDLGEIVEEKSIYFNREDLDEKAVHDIEKGDLGVFDNTFFFRLREQCNGNWVLSFVFSYGREIKSNPTKWYRFSK